MQTGQIKGVDTMEGLLVLLMVGAMLFQAFTIPPLLRLRKRHRDQPGLERRPEVMKLTLRNRWASLVSFVAMVAILIVSNGSSPFALVVVPSFLLWIVSHTIADNSPGHGDGDSGG